MEIQERRKPIQLRIRPAYLVIVGLYSLCGSIALIDGAFSQKWTVLTIFGIAGLAAITIMFIEKWHYQDQKTIKTLLAVAFGFYIIYSMVLVQMAR